MFYKGGTEVHGVLFSHKARVAHEVRAMFFGWHARTGAVPYEKDDLERLPDERNRFPEIGNSANSLSRSFLKEKVFCESVRSGS